MYTVQEHKVQERQGLRHNWSILARSFKIYQLDKRFAAWIVVNFAPLFNQWILSFDYDITFISSHPVHYGMWHIQLMLLTPKLQIQCNTIDTHHNISEQSLYTNCPETKLISSKIGLILAFLAKGKKKNFEKEIH